jgi:fido (protein-threonine AMPylation protein)
MIFEKTIRREVERRLAEISVKPEAILPKTYAALPEIRRGMYQYVYVPFGDTRVWMELRSLNATQIRECGDISLIETLSKKGRPTRQEALELRNTVENLAKAVMNSPTWAEFETMVYGKDNVIKERRAARCAREDRVKDDP